MTNSRTFIVGYLKVLDFIEWFKEYNLEKAFFLNYKSFPKVPLFE